MTAFVEVPSVTAARRWMGIGILRVLWAGSAAAASAALVAVIGVEAMPHARGIGFFPSLRFAVVAPVCVVIAIAGAFVYRSLAGRVGRPRLTFTIVLGGGAFLAFLLMRVAGPSGLATAGLPALVLTSAALALLVPRFLDKPKRSRVGTVVVVVFGALEIAGMVAAVRSERAVPSGASGAAFEIPRREFDADHKFIDLPNGIRVHYVDEGKGETLLFLHGNPSWSFQWRNLITSLRGSYRCVALDYPGFGLSTAPAGFGYTPREESAVVEEFVDALGLHDVTLVMQDWGGPIGLGVAERRPELVRSVILGSTWAWRTSTSEPRGKFSKIAGGPVGEFVQINFNGFTYFALRQGIVRELPRETADAYMRPFVPLKNRGIAAFYPGQITAATDYFTELEAGLPRLADKRALIFWALRDPGFPRADLAKFEKVFPDHNTIEFPNASHFFFEDEEGQMIPEIKGFMSFANSKRVSSRGPSR